MQYREGRCPKCNEVMQIPVERDQIICMFCGHTFSITESMEKLSENYEEDLEQTEKYIQNLFDNAEKAVKKFNRDTYSGSFEQYCAEKKDFLKLLGNLMNESPDRQETVKAIADTVVESAKQIADAQSKINRQGFQMSLNMYMVTFVFPAILSIQEGKLTDLTDEICSKWAETFKGSNIQAADFHTLNGGFRRKLCYITTAVCEGLKKEDDCRELVLLKQYRDEYLARTEEGKAVIAQYYDTAPTIVRRISKREDKREIYRHLYEQYISPCVQCIEAEKNEECKVLYQEMVEGLIQEYLH